MLGRSWGTRIRLTLVAALATGGLGLAAQPASATHAGTVAVSPAVSYTVGAAGHASFALYRVGDELGNVPVQAVDLYPGCLSEFTECGIGLDPGAFTVSTTASGTAVGTIGTGSHFNCAGTWSVSQTANEPGRFRFTGPGTGLELGTNGSGCQIDFTVSALRLPALDLNPDVPGTQTNFNVAATFYFLPQGSQSRVGNWNDTTVLPGAGGGPGGSAPAPTATAPTGQRAAALKKCKKKHAKKARKKCKRKARRLPE
jgi:hypothetical protein